MWRKNSNRKNADRVGALWGPGAAAAALAGVAAFLLWGAAEGGGAAAVTATKEGDPHDLVIAQGRVIDPETELDAVRNVGIRGGEIAAVSAEPLEGREVIDAEGLVVAPGFIDALASHPNTDEAAAFKVHDGVTTLLGMHGGPVETEAWYAEREAKGSAIHYGITVGHGSLRRAVGVEDRYEAATSAQVEEMVALARSSLKRGAVGIGFGVAYVPGSSRLEVLRLFELAAEEDVPVHLHIRSFGPVPPENNGLAALQEVIANAAATGARAHVVHINSMIAGHLEEALAMIEGARQRGVDVFADVYPYTAAATSLASTTFDPGWKDRFGGITYDSLQLVRTMERLDEATFHEGREEGWSAIIHYMPEEEIELAIRHPYAFLASDGTIREGRGHPRGAGTFARILGRYVRERGVVTLPEAIEQITLLPALRLQEAAPALASKGRLSPGADADVVVFDPDRVVDRADFQDPAQRSEGILWTIVDGEVVLADGELREDVRPGRPIRGKGAGVGQEG